MMDAIYKSKHEIAPDVLFIHCWDKTRIKDVVSVLKAVNALVVAACDFDLFNRNQNCKPVIAAFMFDWGTELMANIKLSMTI